MIVIGRTLWIIGFAAFLATAFLFETTVSTRVPSTFGGTTPERVVNLGATTNQILLAIGAAALFVAGVALHGVGLLIHQGRIARVRGTPLDPSIPTSDLTEADLASIGITWDGETWISPNGYKFKPKHLGELVRKVRAIRLAE